MNAAGFPRALPFYVLVISGLLPTPTVFGQAFSGTYTFGTSGSTTSFAYNGLAIANLTVSNLTQSGVSPASSSGNFRATNWAQDSTPVGGLNGAIDTSKYFQFTLTASPGFTFSLTDLNFGFGRSGTGPRQIQWRSSVDTYAAAIPSYSSLGTGTSIFATNAGVLTITDTNSSGTNVVLALSGSSADYTNLTSIGLRFYGYNSEAVGGTGGLQGPLAFSGVLTAAATPELFWNGGSWVTSGPGTGGSGAWADGSGSWDSTKAATFGGSAGTVTAGSVSAAVGLTFNTTGYTLTGGPITLSGSTASLNTVTTGSVASFTSTVNSVLAGTSGMTKAGAGTLVLGAANTFSGNVAINAGTLQIENDSALGDPANDIALVSTLKTTASVSLGSGRDFTGSGTLDIAPSTTLTSSASFNLSATTLSNAGTLNLQGATRSVGILTFGTAATVNGSGPITVSGLTATGVTSGVAFVNPEITFTAGDKTVDVGTGGSLVLFGGVAGTTGRIIKTGLGSLFVRGTNSTSGYRLGVAGATPVNGGTLVLNTAAASGTAQLQLNYGELQVSSPQIFSTGLSIGGRDGAVAVLGGASAMTFTGSSNFFRAPSTSGALRLDVNNATTLAGIVGATSGNGSTTGITIGGTGSLAINGDASLLNDAITLQDSLDLIVGGTLGSAVTVGAGNAIGGDGVIGGSLTLNSGAGFIFNVANTLTVNGASVTFADFGISDLIGFSAAIDDGSYTLIDGSAIINTANLRNLGLANAVDLGGGRSAYFTEGSLVLQVVPEPSAFVLAGMGLALAAAHRLRRRSS